MELYPVASGTNPVLLYKPVPLTTYLQTAGVYSSTTFKYSVFIGPISMFIAVQ
ncbi:MAG: hypothetical protein ACTSU2_05400 [Promethearchaeota archaeon]